MSLSDRDRLHELLIWGGKDSSDGVMVEMSGSQPCGQEEKAVWETGLQVGKEVWAGDKCLAVSSTETVVEITVPQEVG